MSVHTCTLVTNALISLHKITLGSRPDLDDDRLLGKLHRVGEVLVHMLGLGRAEFGASPRGACGTRGG